MLFVINYLILYTFCMQNQAFLVNRWLLSTNAKDIGVLYIIFAGLSGLVGSTLSFMIRKELAGGGNVYFLGNYHDYNVTITGHAILKIFFKVMPALIGGFGRQFSQFTNNDSFGPYLAGLIEGDGTIIVPDIKKNSNATIRICFPSHDKPFVNYLIHRIGHGRINIPKKGNYLLLEFSTYASLYYIVEQTHGFYRTPKQEAFNRLIHWLNIKSLNYLNKPALVPILTYDNCPIFENSWLSGFIDADGNFNVIIAERKNTNNIRIQAQFRLELRQFYHRSAKGLSTNYIDILSVISAYLGVNVYNRARILNNSKTYQYIIVAGTIKSQKLLCNYLNRFPLYTSKYNDYKDWCKIIEINNTKSNKLEKIKLAKLIKSGMNSKRTIFSFDHQSNR